jgi:hypothetical protein
MVLHVLLVYGVLLALCFLCLQEKQYSRVYNPSEETHIAELSRHSEWSRTFLLRNRELRSEIRAADYNLTTFHSDIPQAPSQAPSLCLGFLSTLSRPGLSVLESLASVAVSILQVPRRARPNISVAIQVGITEPEPETVRVMRAAGFSVVSAAPTNVTHPQAVGVAHYTQLLKLCSQSGADVTVVLEDDVWATPGFLAKLLVVLEDLQREVPNGRWLIKLFATDFWSGWETSFGDISMLVLLGLGLGALVSGLVLRCHGQTLCPSRQASKGNSGARFVRCRLLVLYGVSWGLGVGLLHSIGAQHLLLRRNHWVNGLTRFEPSGFTQGIAFSRSVLPSLTDFLRNQTQFHSELPIDLAIGQWRDAQSPVPPQYLVLPCLVEHMGTISSYPEKRRHQERWPFKQLARFSKRAVRFEDHDSEVLDRDIAQYKSEEQTQSNNATFK